MKIKPAIFFYQCFKNSLNKRCNSRKFLCTSFYILFNCDRTYVISKNCVSTNHNLQSYKAPWRILFFGSDNFSLRSLKILYSKFRLGTLISVLDVCTNSGNNCKHNEPYNFAEMEKLRHLKWPIREDDIKNKYDIGIIVSFGLLIPKNVIEEFPLGILNVHASLLPKWRGPAPIIRAVMNGDTETGISVLKINPHKFDTGDIVRQYGVTIKPHETAKELTDRLAGIGAGILMECIRDLPRCLQYAVPQSEENVSYAKKIFASTAKINWNTKSANEVYNQYRALGHLFPLTTYWFDFLIKIRSIKLDEITGMNPENTANIQGLQMKETIIPGLVEYSRRRSVIRIQCKDGKWVYTDSITVSGMKQFSPVQFSNGFIKKVKNSLERRFIVK